MNKKLFSWKALAGVALLAAFSFTSCTSEDPIDSSTPSGVTPTAVKHSVGGDYDWTVAASSVDEFNTFWAEDAEAVKKLVDKRGSASICIIADNFKLENGKAIELPSPFKTGTNGKVLNVYVTGNFKNADFERADAIKNGGVGKDKFPVVIDTKNLAKAEVRLNFTTEKFDLDLKTSTARTTLAGSYTIGYMILAAAPADLDATEIKSGTVEGLDIESTGKFKGSVDGVWTKTAGKAITVTKDGIKCNATGAKNLFVEDDAKLSTIYYVSGKPQSCQLGTVKFVNKADVYTELTINQGATIDKVIGVKNTACWILGDATSAKLVQNIGAMEKVSVWNGGMGIALKADVFTDVIFEDRVTFSTKDITTFDKVEFYGLSITIPEDNQTLNFAAVSFNDEPTISSGIIYTETSGATSVTYQWIINDAGVGGYQKVTKANPITEANKDIEAKVYTNQHVTPNGGVDVASFDKFVPVDANADKDAADEANKSFVVTIVYVTSTAPVVFIPDGTKIVLDKDCKFLDWVNTGKLAQTDYALNLIWGNKEFFDEECWYAVNYAGSDYEWKKVTAGTATGVMFVLKKVAAAE